MRRNSTTLLALALLAVPAVAAADRRSHAFTYGPITAPKGALDLELYGTYYEPAGSTARPFWRHQLELEYGLTDRLDVSLYNVFLRRHGDDLRYEAIKGRVRYRILEPGEYPIDVVLYAEVQKRFMGERPLIFEEKLIAGRDFGPVSLALNLIGEQELDGSEFGLEWGYSAGASYEIHPVLRVGAESFGAAKQVTEAGVGGLELAAWAGPSVSLATALGEGGLLRGAWLTFTGGLGLTDASDRLRLRAILAFQF